MRIRMGSKCVLILLVLFLTMVLHFSSTVVTEADTSIIRVPNDFPTIQEAINAAQNGSTIVVDNGVYYEHLTINKTLTLLGVDRKDTIVDGSDTGDVIKITADNVLVGGFTVRNSSRDGVGILLVGSAGSVVTGNVMTLNGACGIELESSKNNVVSDNVVSSTGFAGGGLVYGDGILLSSSTNNTISDNVITDSILCGTDLESSYNNSIFANTMRLNGVSIHVYKSEGNTFFHNNFIQDRGLSPLLSGNNTWSIGGEGNYWDDYAGLDDGSNGRVAGDGVGDIGLPSHGVDYYPLVNPVNPLLVLWNNTVFPVSLVSNSTVYAGSNPYSFGFSQSDKTFAFNVIGPANTTGYFNLAIPKTLLSGPWTVRLDGADLTSKAAISETQTDTTIYLNYNHTDHSVQVIGTIVIPEYPTAGTLLPSVLLALLPTTIVAIAAMKKKKNKQS